MERTLLESNILTQINNAREDLTYHENKVRTEKEKIFILELALSKLGEQHG